MVELNITKRIFRLINKELEKDGIKVEASAGALVDATMVESAAPNAFRSDSYCPVSVL